MIHCHPVSRGRCHLQTVCQRSVSHHNTQRIPCRSAIGSGNCHFLIASIEGYTCHRLSSRLLTSNDRPPNVIRSVRQLTNGLRNGTVWQRVATAYPTLNKWEIHPCPIRGVHVRCTAVSVIDYHSVVFPIFQTSST